MILKSIFVVTDLFPTPQNPNHGIFIYQWAHHLAQKLDMTVYQAVWDDKHNPLTEKTLKGFRNAFSKDTLPFKWIQRSIKFFPIDRIWIRNIQLLRKIKKEKNIEIADYDVIIGQMGCPGGFVAVKLAKKYNKPSIVGLRGSDVTGYLKRPILKQMALWTYKNCSKIVTVSEDLKKRIIGKEIDGNKIHVIKNGISPVFKILDKELCGKKLNLPSTKLMLFIGEIISTKGVRCLIEALSKLNDIINVNLYLIGSGEERKSLERLANKANITSKVHFMGNINHQNLVDWYNAADVLCLPSLREGIPNVILESLACGTPIVSTEVNGIPEVLSNGKNGFLVPPRNSNLLANALSIALSKEWDRSYLVSTVNTFSWVKNTNNYLALMNKIINN